MSLIGGEGGERARGEIAAGHGGDSFLRLFLLARCRFMFCSACMCRGDANSYALGGERLFLEEGRKADEEERVVNVVGHVRIEC